MIENKKLVSFLLRLPRDEDKAVRNEAKKRGITVTAWIRRAIRDALGKPS